jgi:hypothetical protein
MKYSKGILICVALANVVAIYWGYTTWNKAPQVAVNVEADIRIDPSQLLAEYNIDENAANAKYLDKVIEISGTVNAIAPMDNGSSVSIATGDEMVAIICELASNDATKELKIGDKIIVKGFCTGKLTDIVLVRCSIKS